MAITALLGPYVELNQFPPPAGAPVAGALRSFVAADSLDAQDGGIYRIVATVKIKGTPDVPVSRRVLLCDQMSGRVVRSTWSDPVTGAYVFSGIRNGPFYAVAFDHTGDKRAIIADNLTFENGSMELMS